jgi:hypothetical protein
VKGRAVSVFHRTTFQETALENHVNPSYNWKKKNYAVPTAHIKVVIPLCSQSVERKIQWDRKKQPDIPRKEKLLDNNTDQIE